MDGNFKPALWLRSLWRRSDWTGGAVQRMARAARYLAGAMCLPREHQNFLAFLDGHPLLRACVRRDPGLQERHLRGFVHRHWRRGERLRALQHHYRFALERFPPALFHAIYVRGHAELGELAMKDGSRLQLRLCRPSPPAGEGELCMELGEPGGGAFYRLVLSVIDDHPTMAIGSIRAVGSQSARVSELTHLMYGLRPKQLMLVLAYAFAAQCGIRRVLALGSEARPVRHAVSPLADTFWREQGGVPAELGWFQLPATLEQPTEAEVEIRHRLRFRRRAELRWQAVQLLSQGLFQGPWWSNADRAGDTLESPASLPCDPKEASWIS